MSEKDLENELVARIKAGESDRSLLSRITFRRPAPGARNLGDLVGDHAFKVFQDDTDWNPCKELLVDVIGGMCPDIVIHSTKHKQNRIYIEVKSTAQLSYQKQDSQVVRYFLHLLATTQQKPSKSLGDFGRAVVLAAPARWFESVPNRETWDYFVNTYEPLASNFGIALAEIVLPVGDSTELSEIDCISSSNAR